MFISWLGQNIYQSEISSQKADIEREVQFINSEMLKAQTWMLTSQNELRKESPDPEMILNSAVGYAETTRGIVEAAARIDPDSKVLQKHVDAHKKILGPLQEAARKRNLKGLEETASDMMLWFGAIGREAHKAMDVRAQQVSKSEGFWKRIFQGSFLLGSILLAGTWCKANLGSGRPQRSLA
jgi:hypothetical protein